jgi:hypothetical protein
LNSTRTHILRPPAPLAARIVWALSFACAGLRAEGLPEADLWQSVEPNPRGRSQSDTWIQPNAFRAFHLQHARLSPLLGRAPKEASYSLASSGAVISLPMPDGTQTRFRFVESPVMHPDLAVRFPEIKTYRGQGIDDPAATVRFDLTPVGFHAQILSPRGAVYIEPHLRGNTNLHAVYARQGYRPAAPDFECRTDGTNATAVGSLATPQAVTQVVSSGNLRTYRLACAGTAEYTAYFGGNVSAGLAAIVTAINRVSGVYETELGIRLVLVANNDQIVYTNSSTEPYSNGNPSALLTQNQANLDAVIGSANYDIGHVFSTAGGGLAGVGVACVAGFKAAGETGTYPPVGDAFYIDYVAHEIGHQFGATHSFNSSVNACGYGNRCGTTAYEPGSGSTIMSYAGICSADNLQSHSGAYFHSASLEQILSFTTAGAGNTPSSLSAIGNGAPTVDAGPSYTIPMGTPFSLTATGSDPNGDTLTYSWEERDLGPSISLTASDNGSSPLFRSFNPTTNSARTFPQLSDILNHTTTPGERLPTTSRTLNFRVTARDNNLTGGAVAASDTQVTVATNAGPFLITYPATTATLSGMQAITWNVAGTTNAPVSAASVNILLSTNGGLAFPIVLASNVPNSGACSVLLPLVNAPAARIKVQAVDNIFFAISPASFSIVPPANPSNYPPTLAPIADRTVHAGCVLAITNLASDPTVPPHPLAFSLDPGAPAGTTISSATGVISWPTATASSGTTNTITVRVTQTTSPNLSNVKSFSVVVVPAPRLQPPAFANGAAQLTWDAVVGQRYRVQYKSSLAATNWTDLAPDVTATGSTISVADAPGSSPQGYYRIVVLP